MILKKIAIPLMAIFSVLVAGGLFFNTAYAEIKIQEEEAKQAAVDALKKHFEQLAPGVITDRGAYFDSLYVVRHEGYPSITRERYVNRGNDVLVGDAGIQEVQIKQIKFLDEWYSKPVTASDTGENLQKRLTNVVEIVADMIVVNVERRERIVPNTFHMVFDGGSWKPVWSKWYTYE
mgnify:CR=1 FL=1